MRFEVDHDWQASLATPRPRVGESAKTRLLLLLCLVWLTFGLVGHHPWKPDEAQTVSIIKHLLDGGAWAIPSMAGEPRLDAPPLYYLSAALSVKLLTPWLAFHDAARIVSGLWMLITLLLVGMTGREMWGLGEGRQTSLIFLGSTGLFLSAHLLNNEIAGLTGMGMALYGLALAPRRPWRAAPLIGSGIGIAFLGGGLISAAIPAVCALLLPVLFVSWRRKSFLTSMPIGLAIALPWIGIWLFAAWQQSPALLNSWLDHAFRPGDAGGVMYFIELLSWYTWPAIPLAAWSLWHYRRQLWQRPQFQLALVFLIVSLTLLGLFAEQRDIEALPLLLPLAVMGGAAIEKLRRGAASALDWFGIMAFGFMGFLVWLGWFAMMTGYPARLAKRMHVLSEAYIPQFHWIAFAAACAITLAWGLVVFKANKRSNRAAVTDWATGITMVWGLLMTLWLPWLDAAKGYQIMLADMQRALPAHYACVTGRNLGSAQRAVLDYYLDIQAVRFETAQRIDCDLYLVQDERKPKIAEPGVEWELIWQGKRPSDRRERFFLYQLKR